MVRQKGAGPAAMAVRREYRRALPWVLPSFVVLSVVFGYSVVKLVDTATAFHGERVGLRNFRIVLDNPLFWTAARHNGILLLVVPVMAVISYVLAALVHSQMRGWRFFRSTLLLPFILPIPVVAVVFGQLFQFNGAINQFLRAVGLGFLALDWLGDPSVALWTVGLIIMWREVGLGAILILAALLAVSPSQFEAAALDGAGFVRTHLYIVSQQVRPVILFFVMLEAVTMISNVFSYVFVISNGKGGPGSATMVIELFIYQAAFANRTPGFAAAAALLLLGFTAVLVILLVSIRRLSRREPGRVG